MPRLLASGDVTPEKLVGLLAEQGGRIALMSPEGEAFGLMAGLYGNAPNFEVFLKAHSGDTIRVDRVGRQRTSGHHSLVQARNSRHTRF